MILPVLIALLILLLLIIVVLFIYRCCQQRRGSMDTLDKDLYTMDRTPVILPHEMPALDPHNVRPKKPAIMTYDPHVQQESHKPNTIVMQSGSFPRMHHRRPKSTSFPYRQSRDRDRPNSYTFEGEPSLHHHHHRRTDRDRERDRDARPVTVIFNNFDSIPRRSKPPSYWNDLNEETPPNIVPPPYLNPVTTTTPVSTTSV